MHFSVIFITVNFIQNNHESTSLYKPNKVTHLALFGFTEFMKWSSAL